MQGWLTLRVALFGALVSILSLGACGDDSSASGDGPLPRDGGDGGPGGDGLRSDGPAADGPAGPHWSEAHCQGRRCTFVMQGAAGADDVLCNGRAATDLGTTDKDGKRDCPFASFAPTRELFDPPSGPVRGLSVLVGAGTYDVSPFGLQVRGDGANAAEAVVLAAYGDGMPIIDGTCPKTCTVQTPKGPVLRDPCCQRPCPTCTANPACVPVQGGETACAVPIERTEQLLTIAGQWVRIEGLDLRGCFEDNIRVAYGQTATQVAVPNHHLYLVNNRIEGCDLNENIKGLRQGPGPLQGGPVWGPTHIIGNELHAMASQAVDATGVHDWLVEDNYVHDAKVGANGYGGIFGGGGLGFKDGGSAIRARNNWTERSAGYGAGGASASCAFDVTPPNDWGCFQSYEMIDVLYENNVLIDARSRNALMAFACDDCRFFGNVVEGTASAALLTLDDRCPGPLCEPHNPTLKATRGLRLERNFLSGGQKTQNGGPALVLYYRDTFPTGPAANGMLSRDNIFCVAEGFGEVAQPQKDQQLFGHREPGAVYGLEAYAAQIGDTGSAVFNAPSATTKPCPVAPPACRIGVTADRARWVGPLGCSACSCTLVVDESEQSVPCEGDAAIDTKWGRHYVGLRVNRAGGGTSCGASYQIASPVVGTGCTIDVDHGTVRWQGGGARCRLIADGGRDLGAVPCASSRPLPVQVAGPGRHQLLLRVSQAALGATSCSVMWSSR